MQFFFKTATPNCIGIYIFIWFAQIAWSPNHDPPITIYIGKPIIVGCILSEDAGETAQGAHLLLLLLLLYPKLPPTQTNRNFFGRRCDDDPFLPWLRSDRQKGTEKTLCLGSGGTTTVVGHETTYTAFHP